MKKLTLALVLFGTLTGPALSAETLVVTHGKVPVPTLIDLGPVGESVGDERIWHFAGTGDGNLTVMMDFIMTTTALSADSDGLDSRMTDAVFSIGDGTGDSLLVHGIGLYPKNGSTVKISSTLERAIVGGTGKFAGATGTVLSTHLADGTWKHEFHVK